MTETLAGVAKTMKPRQLAGWVVRQGIINQGIPYTEASRRWPMALPTLNRIMRGDNVSPRFYRVAEINLGLPRGFLAAIITGDVEMVRSMIDRMSDAPAYIREYVIRELDPPDRPPAKRSRR